jgi:hypothetical protein
MSAERLEQSLRELLATADRLERGPRASEEVVPPAAIAPLAEASKPRSSVRTTKRIVLHTAAHTAATVALLVAISALVDPLLPHPDRPHLSESVSAVVDIGAQVPDIPANAADRP